MPKVYIRFNRFVTLTVISVYLVILAGGIVRSTGSGMGCPDWPKCFGSWIPPTREDQLPFFYQKIYLEKRLAKNERVARLLQKIGFNDLSKKIVSDPSVFEEQPFNATKTWIEYINRLVGVLIGLFIIVSFILSLPFWKTDRLVTVLALLAVISVGLEGWIGSIVVSANLMPVTITIHMVLSVALIAILIFLITYSSKSVVFNGQISERDRIVKVSLLLFIGSTAQLLLGTQVRENVDLLMVSLPSRDQVVDALGFVFKIHRSFSIAILLCTVYLYLLVNKFGQNRNFWYLGRILLVILGLEMTSGIAMAWFGLPAFFQPIHLLGGCLLVGISIYTYFTLRKADCRIQELN